MNHKTKKILSIILLFLAILFVILGIIKLPIMLVILPLAALFYLSEMLEDSNY